MSPWVYLRLLVLPLLLIASAYMGGWWTFSVPLFIMVLHPLAVIIFNRRAGDVTDKIHSRYPELAYKLVALAFVPVLIAITAWSVINSTGFSIIEQAGLALSVGTVNGVLGFTLAHEFIHSRWLPEKIAGRLLLVQNNYPHYDIEHIAGHHLYACTPKDPHTAKFGESIYSFLLRTLPQTFSNAWEIEVARLRRKKYRIISRHNRMINMIALQFSLYAMIIVAAGWLPFAFFIFQSFIAIILLNITEYLQHYGLLRKETEQGRFEKISALHAWSSARSEDCFSLFQLDNHADHHMHPAHPYEQLVHLHESPEQPTGYSGMMWLALVPPLWFSVMNKRILSHYSKTPSHENSSTP